MSNKDDDVMITWVMQTGAKRKGRSSPSFVKDSERLERPLQVDTPTIDCNRSCIDFYKSIKGLS